MKGSWTRRWLLSAGTAAIAFGGVAILRAQYSGHIDTQKKPSATSTLRSVAVLEWTGDRNHPNATRLVPVSLFDGENLQDGALYLATGAGLILLSLVDLRERARAELGERVRTGGRPVVLARWTAGRTRAGAR